MPGVEFFKGNDVMLFKEVYLVSLLLVFSASEFYEVGGFVEVIGIPFNNTVGTVIKKIQEGFGNIIYVRVKTTAIIYITHYGKTFIQGVLNVVLPQGWEHHTHPLGSYSKETEIVINKLP